MASKGVDNAQAIVGMILTLLPWILRIFGVDIPDVAGFEHSSELTVAALGGAMAVNGSLKA